jgi:hypothetical protein
MRCDERLLLALGESFTLITSFIIRKKTMITGGYCKLAAHGAGGVTLVALTIQECKPLKK